MPASVLHQVSPPPDRLRGLSGGGQYRSCGLACSHGTEQFALEYLLRDTLSIRVPSLQRRDWSLPRGPGNSMMTGASRPSIILTSQSHRNMSGESSDIAFCAGELSRTINGLR
jgi:hypothetical protein